MATPLHPSVSLADVVRHAIRECHGKFVTSGQRPIEPGILPAPATTAEA